jgi:hypothetical protein
MSSGSAYSEAYNQGLQKATEQNILNTATKGGRRSRRSRRSGRKLRGGAVVVPQVHTLYTDGGQTQSNNTNLFSAAAITGEQARYDSAVTKGGSRRKSHKRSRKLRKSHKRSRHHM